MKRFTSLLLTLLMLIHMVPAIYATESGSETMPTAINADTVWSYLDDGTDPAGDPSAEGYERTSWTAVNYDDSAWKTSKGSLGAKRGAIGSVDGYTPDYLLNQYKEDGVTNLEAFFFRTEVMVEDASAIHQILGTVIYDDSATIYINGTKVAGFDDSEITANLQYGGHNASTAEGIINITDAETLAVLRNGVNVVAVEVHQGRPTSSDVYFGMPSLEFREEAYVEEVALSNVSLSMGVDQTEMNFTWHINDETAGKMLVAKADELVNQNMPEDAATYSATSVLNNDGKYTNKTTVTGLEPNTTYAYQLINGEVKSDIYHFTTGGDEAFSFAYVGDPQIGAGGNVTSDSTGWDNTLQIVAEHETFSDISFMLSVGDQVNNASNEKEYDGYLDHEALKGLPVATVIGNHDSSSDAYSQHFNVPNEDDTYGTSTTAGSDYWFVYNNVLFMVINSNNMSIAAHKAFLEEAIAANPDVDWKIVTFHHAIYTVASHAEDSDILQRREYAVPIFDELDIDVVLMGHDHVYCRTYMMDGFEPMTDASIYDDENYSSITDPEGILYVTANSGSGSKHYSIKNTVYPYSAVQNQERVPNVSKVSISKDQFTITTYRTSDMTEVDTFTIHHTTLDNIEITTQPTKTVYTEGEKFDPTGMVVTATYTDSSTKVIEDYTYAPADELTADVTEITVTYEGKTATVPVTVNKVTVDINTTSDTGLVEYLSSYSTGYTNKDGGVAEIVMFNKENDCMYLVSGQTQTLDIVKVNDDGSTSLVKKVDVAELGIANNFSAGDITSVDVNTCLNLVAIAVQNADYTANGVIVTLDYAGNFITKYEAGVQPDMVTFSPDGNYILSANEGEPREGYESTDPMGSVTVVDLIKSTATNYTFESLDSSRDALVDGGVLLKVDTAPSVDLEPEFIAVSSDSRTAYVTLQENNAVAALDLTTGTWKYVKGLGFKDHSAEGNGLDLDQDGKIDIRNENVYGVYMPDGIAVVTIDGQDYLVTANEGDAREWGDYENIDSDKLVLADGEKAGKKIEFLDTTKTDGLTTGNTYVLGGRSFSIWNVETMEQVFDSGDDFEVITAAEFPEYFNSGHDEAGLDKRSHKKGVEPESVSILETNGKIYAIVGLERMGGIMVYDISDPDNAVYADYLNVRGFSDTVTALNRLGDLGPEGICTVPAEDSPTGNAMILVANEISGTVTVAQIEKAAAFTFEDVDEDAYYAPAVKWAVENGITIGTSSTTFSPNRACTRAQIITYLWRAAGSPVPTNGLMPFKDVSADTYYYNAVLWAVENGITNGTSSTTFSPDQACTRAQCVTFLWRSQNAPKAKEAQMAFTDVFDSTYYYNAVLWAVENGITNGTSTTTFSPDQACTRAQCVTFLWRAMAD